MPTPTQFAPDFFNNVAAIAVVLMFAKLVTHRSRRTHRTGAEVKWLLLLHLACLGAAGVAVVVSMIAVSTESTDEWLQRSGWIAVAVAGLIVIGDVAVEDWRQASADSKKSASTTTAGGARPLP